MVALSSLATETNITWQDHKIKVGQENRERGGSAIQLCVVRQTERQTAPLPTPWPSAGRRRAPSAQRPPASRRSWSIGGRSPGSTSSCRTSQSLGEIQRLVSEWLRTPQTHVTAEFMIWEMYRNTHILNICTLKRWTVTYFIATTSIYKK